MSTCVVKFDPRSIYTEIAVLESRERSVVFSLLLEMWCHEGHVEHNAAKNARRSGMRPSSFAKVFARLVEGGTFNVIDGRIYPGRRIQSAMRRVSLSPDQRARALRYCKQLCVYCGDESGPFEIDHIFPASRGGTNHERNLALACFPCNSSKRDHLLSEFRGDGE